VPLFALLPSVESPAGRRQASVAAAAFRSAVRSFGAVPSEAKRCSRQLPCDFSRSGLGSHHRFRSSMRPLPGFRGAGGMRRTEHMQLLRATHRPHHRFTSPGGKATSPPAKPAEACKSACDAIRRAGRPTASVDDDEQGPAPGARAERKTGLFLPGEAGRARGTCAAAPARGCVWDEQTKACG
jgi:hypothetical protein